MASFGNAKVGEELMRNVIESSGKEYSSGSTYDLEFRGAGVNIVEYDVEGRKIDSLIYTQENTKLADYTLEMQEIMRIHNKNVFKQRLYALFIIFVCSSCSLAFLISLWLREV